MVVSCCSAKVAVIATPAPTEIVNCIIRPTPAPRPPSTSRGRGYSGANGWNPAEGQAFAGQGSGDQATGKAHANQVGQASAKRKINELIGAKEA